MSDIEKLAEKVNVETPWWAAVPVLAAAIVGVPSFLAIAGLFYIAQHVSSALAQLVTMNQSEISMLHEQLNQTKHDMDVVLQFVQDELRAQYQTCIQSAKTARDRNDCLSPTEREQIYGIKPPK